MARRYMVESGWCDENNFTIASPDEIGRFATIEEAREAFEAEDIVTTWETERSCRGRALDRDAYKAIWEITVDENGDVLDYEEIIERETYNRDDIERAERERIEYEAWREWHCEGWYRIAYSDGGQDFTNDGPIWLDSYTDLANELEAAYSNATETHLPYIEYLGDVTTSGKPGCPVCGCDDNDGGSFEVDDGCAFQRFTCHRCGSNYVEVYTFHQSEAY